MDTGLVNNHAKNSPWRKVSPLCMKLHMYWVLRNLFGVKSSHQVHKDNDGVKSSL